MDTNITITVEPALVDKMREYYADYKVTNNGEYIDFQAKVNGVLVTAYTSKKSTRKVTFMGANALKEAQIWNPEAKEKEKKVTVKEQWVFEGDQIGSDEVGVGDFLGPMIVVAAYTDAKGVKRLKELGIHDSKKMNDKQILEVGAILIKEFQVSKLTLHNEKYNEMITKGENLNSMKAKMHNRALLNLHKKFPQVEYICIDEFVKPETYYKYLNDENEEQVKNLVSRTKGESHFPSVALASVVARYCFLKEMEALSKKYKMEFPYGSSQKVTDFAKKFVKKYGVDELAKVAKKNFANYREVIEL